MYMRKAKFWRVVRNLTIFAVLGECVGYIYINFQMDNLRNGKTDDKEKIKIPGYLQLPMWLIIGLESLILLTTFILIITNIEFFFNKYRVKALGQANLSPKTKDSEILNERVKASLQNA